MSSDTGPAAQASPAPAAELPPPPPYTDEIAIEDGALPGLRRVVAAAGETAGLAPTRVWDLVMAVHELAMNSLVHGGGRGVLCVWRDEDAVVCEVRDSGFIDDPAIGHRRPDPDCDSGRGLWIVNQLCDLVQIRSSTEGTTVRVRIGIG